MSSNPAANPLRPYRRTGQLVLGIDEHRFRADALLQSHSRLLDRDGFLAVAGENIFELLHDDEAASPPAAALRRGKLKAI